MQLACQWCGCTGTEEAFEIDEKHADGFWCPNCDGHTFFDAKANVKRKLILLLEDPAARAEYNERGLTKARYKTRLSPLRYPGGKSRMINLLGSYLNPENCETFYEIYAGGASFGLSMLEAGKIKRLVLNDIDRGVYSLWKTIIENPKYLLLRINHHTPTREDYFTAKQMLARKGTEDTELLAYAMLLVNRLSYSGIALAHPLGGKGGTTAQLLQRWNPAALTKRINHIHAMADQIKVMNKDGCTLLQEAYWTPNSTVFIDPPYYEKGPKLYPCAFNEDKHKELADTACLLFQGMPGSDVVITYDNADYIRRLYWAATVEVIPCAYSA